MLAVTRSAEKAALARELSADETLDASSGERQVADVVVGCSGDPAAAALALDLALPSGRVGLYGVYRSAARIDLNQIAELKELVVAGGRLASGCFPAAVRLLASVPADLIVTAIRTLDQARTALEPAPRARLKEILVP